MLGRLHMSGMPRHHAGNRGPGSPRLAHPAPGPMRFRGRRRLQGGAHRSAGPITEMNIVKLLLTSAGIKNPSIHRALLDLLGKPIAESSALCISTASYAMKGGANLAWSFISGQEPETPMVELGWKSMGVLELTALASVDQEVWVPAVRETDILLVNGGDPLFLYHWMRQSGLADLLPTLTGTVYAGLSAGSMIMAPRIGQEFVEWTPPTGDSD